MSWFFSDAAGSESSWLVLSLKKERRGWLPRTRDDRKADLRRGLTSTRSGQESNGSLECPSGSYEKSGRSSVARRDRGLGGDPPVLLLTLPLRAPPSAELACVSSNGREPTRGSVDDPRETWDMMMVVGIKR